MRSRTFDDIGACVLKSAEKPVITSMAVIGLANPFRSGNQSLGQSDEICHAASTTGFRVGNGIEEPQLHSHGVLEVDDIQAGQVLALSPRVPQRDPLGAALVPVWVPIFRPRH